MNVIVIVTDSLRRDHVGCYGNPWIRTPNIDAFAQESALFEEAYSEGLPTLPTRTAWWTGRFTFPFRGWQHFEPSDALLSEVLWSRGYTTALVTDVYHVHKPGMNCGRGWDTVRFIRGQEYDPYVTDPSIQVDLTATHKLRGDETDAMWRERFEQSLRNGTAREREEDYGVAQCVQAGIEWLEAQRRRDRLFLWLDCFDPHEPWDPPAPFDTLYDPDYQGVALVDPVPGPVEGYLSERELRHVKALYAGEVSFVDKWVGVFLDAVRRMGLMENTLIVYTTDHGEPFGEHGYIRKCRPENWEELVHIPLLVRHPEGLGAGRRIPAFVETCDLMSTLLDALGIAGGVDSPAHRQAPPMHGRSMLPLLTGRAEALREYAYVGHHGRSWNIRSREWSYHLWLTGNRAPSLFHRPTDPGEHHDVLHENRAVGDALELELRRFVAGLR